MKRIRNTGAILPLCAILFTASPVHAQQSPQDDVNGANAPVGTRSDDDSRRTTRTDIVPYLEIDQIVVADLNRGGDVLTYTALAAGVDALVSTRRAEGQVSLRYERRIAYDDNIGDQDVISGLARGSVQIVPNQVTLEAGGIATRSTVDLRGPVTSNLVGGTDNVTDVYSVYAGPTVTTNIGNVGVNAAYRLGYTRVEAPNAILLLPGQPAIDAFDDSVSQSFSASVGQQPGELPFGWSVGGGYNREDASQLDQRFTDAHVRADVTVPVSSALAVVGGVGYEDVKVSERDALRDPDGAPLRGSDGRFVTDDNSPRLLSYNEEGLIWDVGVLWRPSRRTSLEARVGRRYGSTTYTGTFSFQPSRNTGVNIAVYDVVTGFGSRLNNSLATLPTNFNTIRNPLSGELNPCVFSAAGGSCFNDTLQSVASSSFRARGVAASLSTKVDGWDTGVGIGYNRRRFFASELGALAFANGTIDENYYANFFLGRVLDSRSSVNANVYANYLESGLNGAGDTLNLGANAAYYRNILAGLSATAAVGLESIDQDGFENELIGSAQVGIRYSF